jgi:NADH-quinone oxidoreductase subunit E
VVTTAARNDDFSYRLWRYNGAPGELIPLLQSAQDHFGYIPRRAISYIAGVTGVPESEVYGVITFYSQFRLQPMLGVEVGGTTEDGLFTLSTVACIGCCSLAPVMMINDDTHGRLTPQSVRKILREYRRRETAARAQDAASCSETGAR